VREWRNQLHTIYEDVVGLHHSRHLLQDVREIYEGNPALQRDHVFINWLTQNYAAAMAVGIRQQADRSDDAISMANLITDLEINADKLTRAWFVGEYLRRAPENDKAYWEYSANKDFDQFAPNGAAYASVGLLQDDQSKLQSIANDVRLFVNRRLAHQSLKQVVQPITLKDLRAALDQFGELLKRYHLLLEQAGLSGAEPTIQTDWKAVLRVPWIRT
jgi:HEPN superfamily AbiU2-like protein